MIHKFEKIVSIRQKRVDKARDNLRQSEVVHSESMEKVSSISEEIESYAEEIRGLEVSLMSELLQRRITQLDLARVREKLNEVEQHATELNLKRVKAREALAASKRQLKLAREDAKFLTRKSETIRLINEKLKSDMIEEMRYVTDRAEEDFMPAPNSGDRNVGY